MEREARRGIGSEYLDTFSAFALNRVEGMHKISVK